MADKSLLRSKELGAPLLTSTGDQLAGFLSMLFGQGKQTGSPKALESSETFEQAKVDSTDPKMSKALLFLDELRQGKDLPYTSKEAARLRKTLLGNPALGLTAADLDQLSYDWHDKQRAAGLSGKK